MMSSKKCCVAGCDFNKDTPRVLHLFPNPATDKERFTRWVLSIGGDIVGLTNDYIYKQRRVCHEHFDLKFCCRYNRISNKAVPTLNLPGPLALPRFSFTEPPLRRLQENEPSTSKGFTPELFASSLRPMQNLPLNKPSTSKGFTPELFTSASENENLMKENIDPVKDVINIQDASIIALVDTMSASHTNDQEKRISVTLVAKPKKLYKKTKNLAKRTPAEHNLYKKLVNIRVKLSKCTNRNRKQSAALLAAKKITTNPCFLKTLEDLPSTAKILTLMQFRENKKKNKGRRFTSDEKILALSIFKQSPKAYRFLRKILILPAAQTLSKLIQKANLAPGINQKVFLQLKKRAQKMKEQDRICVLLFDEMSLAANVSYNERKDRVTGFVNNGKETKPEYADHAQVFMIRGLMRNYKQPLSYSFSASATKGPELCRQIKEIINAIQQAGLIVVATICDQGTNNRQAIKLLLQETHGALLRTGQEPKNNTLIINNQEIVPLYDVPHLLKCMRNNLISKNLKYTVDDTTRTAKWEHLELLLKENPGYRGVRIIPKLTENHIIPNKIPKMKVKYASQVFSQTVANNMGYLADKGILPVECKETADLLLMFDALFDSLNGSYGRKAFAKPLLGPVKPYSVHNETWNNAKKVMSTMKFVDKKTGKAESVPTLKNWVWTLDNVQILIKALNIKYGITSVWMRHLNQDPIENYFGAVRSHGCRNTNPTAEKFESAFTTLLLNNMSSVHAVGANCEQDLCENLHALVITDCEDATTACEIDNIPDIELKSIEEKKDPRILGPLQYVSGYFFRQSQNKIFKNCNTCKRDLSTTEDIEYIGYREFTGSRWLKYPNQKLLSAISDLQDIIYTLIKENLEKKLLKQYIKTIIFMFLEFNFITCKQHKEKLVEFLINLACRFFIFNYCKTINKILSGKRDCDDDEDPFAVKAKKMHYKCSKRKK